MNETEQRLLRLADKLEGTGSYADEGPIPADHFDLEDFYDVRGVPWDAHELAASRLKNLDYNTVGCAIGWAAIDPWFNERGLYPTKKIFEDSHNFFPTLAWNDWSHLFIKESYEDETFNPTPADVARRIRSLLTNWGI